MTDTRIESTQRFCSVFQRISLFYFERNRNNSKTIDERQVHSFWSLDHPYQSKHLVTIWTSPSSSENGCMIRDADKLCETGFRRPSCSRPLAVAPSDTAFEAVQREAVSDQKRRNNDGATGALLRWITGSNTQSLPELHCETYDNALDCSPK